MSSSDRMISVTGVSLWVRAFKPQGSGGCKGGASGGSISGKRKAGRSSGEERVAGLERVDENVDLGLGVVETEGGPASGGQAEVGHQRLGAVMAVADGDTL